MTNEEMILAKMQASIENIDPDAAVLAAKEALAAGIDPGRALDQGFAVALRKVGDAFERMDIFLPQLIQSANAMKSGMAVLESAIKASGGTVSHKGIVVLGTVEGDIHDIGKTIVGAMLQANGYDVHDLGVDVPPTRFIQMAEEARANVIAISALLSTTMLRQRDVLELMRNKGLSQKYFTIVGGAPVTKAWAEEIGANAYGRDAIDAVNVLNQHAQEWAK